MMQVSIRHPRRFKQTTEYNIEYNMKRRKVKFKSDKFGEHELRSHKTVIQEWARDLGNPALFGFFLIFVQIIEQLAGEKQFSEFS